MKRKRQLKPVIQKVKWLANQVDMHFTKKILGKYGVGNFKGQFTSLIFRRYRTILAGEEKKTNCESNTIVKNYSNYFNVNKSVFKLTTQVISLINVKSNKKSPDIFNILRDAQGNSRDYSNVNKSTYKLTTQAINSINTKSNREWLVPFNILRYTQENNRDYSIEKQQQSSSEISSVNKLTAVNILKQFSEKFNETLSKKLTDHNGEYVNGKAESKWVGLQQKQVFNKAVGKTVQLASEPKSLSLKLQTAKNQLSTLVVQNQHKNNQHFSPFSDSQRQSVDLLYNKNPQGELNSLAPNFSKVVTIKQSLQKRTTEKLGKAVRHSRDPQISLDKNTDIETVMQDKKRSMVLKTSQNVEEEKTLENEQEAFRKNEMILHTSLAKSLANKGFTPKTNGFIKSVLKQADGAMSRILKNLSKKQETADSQNSFFKKNIYQSSTELIPAEVKNNRDAREISKLIEIQGIKKLSEKLNDSSLILCKPQIKETSLKTEQTPKDVMISDKEVYAKAVNSLKPNGKFKDLEVEEVNLIAEKVLKVLEKRMAIQKDRRGLR